MTARTRAAALLSALLSALLMLSACGDDKPDAGPAAPGGQAGGQAGAPTPAASVAAGVPTPLASVGAKPATSARPTKPATSTKPARPKPAATSTSVAAVPTPTPKAVKLLYPSAMPDGRTAPANSDFSFGNLKLDQRFLGTTIATVDVTYKGPGYADGSFTALVTYTTEDGVKQTVSLSGMITRIASGSTVNVRLSGASNLPPRIKPGYSAKYTVNSVSGSAPAARSE